VTPAQRPVVAGVLLPEACSRVQVDARGAQPRVKSQAWTVETRVKVQAWTVETRLTAVLDKDDLLNRNINVCTVVSVGLNISVVCRHHS
jgi:hypothetical protein